MNLKKIVLLALPAILVVILSACTPKQILLVDTNLNQVMHQIAEVPSGVENGQYHLFCYDDLNLRYWWTSGYMTVQEQNISYTADISYIPRTSRVTVNVMISNDSKIVFNYGTEFTKGDSANYWQSGLLALAKTNGYEDGVVNLLGSIDLDQILSSVDDEAPILLSQYACVYADR
ncbi:hypothetical protein A2572_01975 [Candidatus Collierbacteria bacterium RIFOXYD1_FULL_40_9]|uniref:Uncharacterized protein n=1 Tax=Candidatus Collierbacteria bacterium RIFOXYD1_FULL_40_9 TaxID=1817731 RepID=A0A1F5FTE4_9BACT|nr:MAG: hypothetical protein A2572_01975 [Candidatus Collierbacteria bacterium RIFOXYD1_FULL_40_9]